MQLACSLWVCKVGAQAVIYSLHALWNSIITQRRSSEVDIIPGKWLEEFAKNAEHDFLKDGITPDHWSTVELRVRAAAQEDIGR